jgi:putative NADPH-quinone reductase
MKTLVILSHPTLESSIANTTIIEQLQRSKHNIKIRHLETIHNSYNIDVEAEQQALIEADTIIFQFPFFWYSMPAALKNWLDLVLTYNFAYGPEGNKLKGKNLIISTTIGGSKEAYTPLGYNHFNVLDLLKPLQQTAYLTQMNWHEPIFTHSMAVSNNSKEDIVVRAIEHSQKLLSMLQKLKESINE